MLRKKFRGAIFSRFSTCRFLHIVTSLGGYLTYIWILRENAFFLDPGFISGKWVGMLRIIYRAQEIAHGVIQAEHGVSRFDSVN